jgi:hypothetical protein
MDITELLTFIVKNKASDLHLSSGLPPMIRVHGDIRRINLPAMEHKDVHAMIYDIMNDGQRKAYEENLECDFSFAVPNLARFRVNAFVQNRGAAAAARPGAGDRPDRLGQVDHAGGDDRLHQHHRARPHPHDRGPDRVRAPEQAVRVTQREVGHDQARRSRTRCAARCARTRT